MKAFKNTISLLLIFILSLDCSNSFALSGGEVKFEFRKFDDDNVSTNVDEGYSVFTRVDHQEKFYDTFDFSLRTYARIDRKDSARDVWEIEDLNISKRLGDNEAWKVLAGYKIFNFTAMEAFHPADVINSRNLDSDFDNFEKKGELTLELTRDFYEGEVSLYYFPRLEKPHYPSSSSRLGAGVNLESPIFVEGTDVTQDLKFTPQWGVKVYQSVIEGDLTVFALKHFDRNFPVVGSNNYASVLGSLVPVGGFKFIPHYFEVFETGLTYQLPYERFIFKVEAVYRDFEQDFRVLDSSLTLTNNPDHTDAAFGVEYINNLDNGHEYTLILEYERFFGISKEQRADLSIFQNDLLVGVRYSLNDTMSTEFFASVIVDLERSTEYFYNLKASRRINDRWSGSLGVRLVDAPKKGTRAKGLETLDEDNYGHINLTRYF